MAWYKIVGLSRLTYMLYKGFYKQDCKLLPHGNKGTHKLCITMWQAKSNRQSLIDLCVNTMSHQMKGIGSGR